MESINLLPSQFLHFEPQALPANLINLGSKEVSPKFLLNHNYSIQIFVLKYLQQK